MMDSTGLMQALQPHPWTLTSSPSKPPLDFYLEWGEGEVEDKGVAIQWQIFKAVAAGRQHLLHPRYRTQHKTKTVLCSSYKYNVSQL